MKKYNWFTIWPIYVQNVRKTWLVANWKNNNRRKNQAPTWISNGRLLTNYKSVFSEKPTLDPGSICAKMISERKVQKSKSRAQSGKDSE